MLKVKYGLIASFIFSLAMSHANAETLNFASSKGNLKPFYWEENDGSQHGIIPDIIKSASGIELNFITLPIKRIDPFIRAGHINIAMLHPNYTQEDEKLFFLPLRFNQKNILFTHINTPATPNKLEDVRDTAICARNGFIYINMTERWEEQNIRRENAKSNRHVLQMLDLKRCDFAIGSSVSMKYLIKQQKMNNIRETDIVVTEIPRFLAISKKIPHIKNKLNAHIKKLKQTGELDRIIKKYAP